MSLGISVETCLTSHKCRRNAIFIRNGGGCIYFVLFGTDGHSELCTIKGGISRGMCRRGGRRFLGGENGRDKKHGTHKGTVGLRLGKGDKRVQCVRVNKESQGRTRWHH